MRRLATRVFAPLSLVLVSACAGYVVSPTAPPDDKTPANAAKVCVVRVGSDGALLTFPFRDNNVLVGATIGGSCFCYLAGVGHHELEARSDGFDSLAIDVEAQKEYYVVQATRAAVGIVRSRLELLQGDEGRSAMQKCQYSVLTQVPEGTYLNKPGAVVVAK
ncbi:MAG: hypothetical protein IPK82_37950 [Polyangiaceae bacterium]|nr:hypothetical protein [Polyangiaceae bacterium]